MHLLLVMHDWDGVSDQYNTIPDNIWKHRLTFYCVQLYDQVSVAELTLINTGRVGFEYVGIGMDSCFETSPRPGRAVLMPHMVRIHCTFSARWFVEKYAKPLTFIRLQLHQIFTF